MTSSISSFSAARTNLPLTNEGVITRKRKKALSPSTLIPATNKISIPPQFRLPFLSAPNDDTAKSLFQKVFPQDAPCLFSPEKMKVYEQTIKKEGISKNLAVAWISDAFGYGIFATKKIPKDSLIGVYSGIFTYYNEDPSDTQHLYVLKTEHLNINLTLGIQANLTGNFTRYINHGEPEHTNVEWRQVENSTYPGIYLMASKEIPQGHQLLCNYGEKYDWKGKEKSDITPEMFVLDASAKQPSISEIPQLTTSAKTRRSAFISVIHKKDDSKQIAETSDRRQLNEPIPIPQSYWERIQYYQTLKNGYLNQLKTVDEEIQAATALDHLHQLQIAKHHLQALFYKTHEEFLANVTFYNLIQEERHSQRLVSLKPLPAYIPGLVKSKSTEEPHNNL